MIILLICGLIGVSLASKSVNKVNRIGWKLAIITVLSLFSLSLTIVYFLVTGVSILGNLSDPISEAIRMDAFFMEMLSYGFSYMVGMIFVMTYCCTSISEQKEINFKHSILIALLIEFCTVIIVEVLVRIFFGL